jgi:hypothetical protein
VDFAIRHKEGDFLSGIDAAARVASRYDRCAHTLFSAICIAATVTFWLRW